MEPLAPDYDESVEDWLDTEKAQDELLATLLLPKPYRQIRCMDADLLLDVVLLDRIKTDW